MACAPHAHFSKEDRAPPASLPRKNLVDGEEVHLAVAGGAQAARPALDQRAVAELAPDPPTAALRSLPGGGNVVARSALQCPIMRLAAAAR